ncbi:MAG: hypothetical protein LBH11_04350 [Propionibacteriaceae bacterium]|jgi:hypothetical protein|nr:hypothetical protein [Propionibacteriaceae bacterium]
MAVILLASATGSPGVTTTALGLTLAWPRAVMLLDADRDAGQSVLAGYLAGCDATGRALHHLIQPYRQGVSLRPALRANLMPLNDAASFLPGFTHPAAAAGFEPVWPSLGVEVAALDDENTDVLLDCGRVRNGLPQGLLDCAVLLLLVARSSLRSLAGVSAAMRSLRETTVPASAEVALLLVGPDHPYSATEIGDQFEIPIAAVLPWSPDEAAVLSDGAAPLRRRGGDTLTKAFQTAARTVSDRALRRQNLLRADPLLGVTA